MRLVQVPEHVKNARPECEVVSMGPPRGVPDEEVGTAQMLISPVEYGISNFPARRQYAYYKPTEADLKNLADGGVIEICQYGNVVQPFSAASWPPAPAEGEK